MATAAQCFIEEREVQQTLESAQGDPARARAVLQKARSLAGLSIPEVAELLAVRDPDVVEEIYHSAREVKDTIYGSRLVLFAPLYISNYCANECVYCAFRARNRDLPRRALTQPEIAAEVKTLVEQGHKRILMVAGESYPNGGIDYIFESIRTIYSTRSGNGEIRRVNVNLAPLTVGEFRALKAEKIGTYQLFQETYHRETYAQVHLAGRKRDYDWRVQAMHRAMEAGINDVGIGVLFGLYDWRFEILAMMQHIHSLEREYGAGPHTISVPRLEPAAGSEFAGASPYAVSDDDFRRIVAVLRLAVPYTGIIMSTRESPEMRNRTLQLGVSQISAGSRCDPGAYAAGGDGQYGQFQLGDHRPLDEVVRDAASMGFIPSFCTACYRLGRTGADFMDLAKPGEIKTHCAPNALSTYQEYLLDYASPETRAAGEKLIQIQLSEAAPVAAHLVERVRRGERDVYV
jgi:2-iminoacetate synthase